MLGSHHSGDIHELITIASQSWLQQVNLNSSYARVNKRFYITYLGIELADVMNFNLILFRTVHVRVARRIVYKESAATQ